MRAGDLPHAVEDAADAEIGDELEAARRWGHFSFRAAARDIGQCCADNSA
jgi:hypothetical protein